MKICNTACIFDIIIGGFIARRNSDFVAGRRMTYRSYAKGRRADKCITIDKYLKETLMDYIREMLNAGSRIMETVNDAIDSGDYSNLTKKITEEMSGYTKNATSDVRKRMQGAGKSYGNWTYGSRPYSSYNVNRGPRNANAYGYRPVDIDLGTRQKDRQGSQQGQYSQGRQNRQSYSNYRTGNSAGTGSASGYGNAGKTSGSGGFWGGASGSGGGHDAGQSGTQGQAYSGYGRPGYSGGQGQAGQYQTNQGQSNQGQRPGAATNANSNIPNSATNSRVTPFNQYKKNAGSGLLKQTAGVTGLFITVPVVVANIAAAAATGGLSTIVTAAMFGAGAGVSGYFTQKGARQRKLSKIFDKYSKIVGSAEYMTIEDLAEKAGEHPDIVQKNLDEMIEIGMLPQLKYDQKKTTMMLTKNAYDQYLLAENSRQEREKAEAELDSQAGSAEARKVITEGEEFVTKIRKANDLIPGEEMTGKLDQMERIVSKIFAQVKKDPTTAGDLRKFMNYYLPTTEKLLDAYVDLDKQPEIGENIPKTKREIEATVDTINDAFENLLDSLFEDVAWDISSDISVMKTMMEQDGLTKKGFKATDQAKSSQVESEKAAENQTGENEAAGVNEAAKANEAVGVSETAELNEAENNMDDSADAFTESSAEQYEPELKFDE